MRRRFPRYLLFRRVGLYFVISSLVLILVMLWFLASIPNDGPFAFGSAIFVLLILAGLLNLTVGLVIVLASSLRRKVVGKDSINLYQPQASWLSQVLLACLLATPLYGLTALGSFFVVGVVFTNGLMWWYGWQMPKINTGDSRQRVEAIVGQPGWHSECDSPYVQSYSQVTDLSQCHSISLYYQHQGNKQWEIAYDAEDEMISKQYFQRDQ